MQVEVVEEEEEEEGGEEELEVEVEEEVGTFLVYSYRQETGLSAVITT